jgi:Ca2+-binding RTX toxin-like protein
MGKNLGTISQMRWLGGGSGNTLTQAQILAELLKSTSGDDWLRGYANTNDSIAGSGGNDTLSGEAGSDTYVFGLGFGQDVIADRGASGEVDTLKFNVGIRPAEVGVARAGNDLVVSFAGAPGDGVRISDSFDETFSALGLNRQIEQFAFADGSTWSATAIRAKVLVPTAGDDEITGYLGSESLSGLAGDDTIAGGAGRETIRSAVAMARTG